LGIHAEFEKIHPFADGNGWTGRLLMSYMLILYGLPPAIIFKNQSSRYLRALERVQGNNPDYSMLTELVARAVRENLNKLLLPHISEKEDLLPLSALTEGTPYRSNYLRTLAQRGKLKAIKDGSLWLSGKDWLNEYLNSKDARGRKKG
jgi:Fic family protein